jgi:hypothetical protein
MTRLRCQGDQGRVRTDRAVILRVVLNKGTLE